MSEDDDSLPTVQAPYLPSKLANNKKYTLVLDLDETLIHYVEYSQGPNGQEQGGNFLIRPGCHAFLKEMVQYYEIVIFTAAMQDVSIMLNMLTFVNIVCRLGT